MDFPTFSDLERVARDEALANNNVLTKEVIERHGTDANSLIAASAAVGDDLSGQLTQANAGLFFSTSRGNQLDLLAADRFQGELPRKTAAPARVTARFFLPVAPGTGFSIPSGTTVSTADGRVFRTLAQATFPNTVTFIDVVTQSVLAGLNQQIVAGSLTSITGTIAGAPTTLQVTNLLASFGADDDEQDDDYKRRCQSFYPSTRRGTLAAIEQGALTVPGVRSATAYEGDRFVGLIVADAFVAQLINATAIPANYQVQSDALANTIQTTLKSWRGGGVQVVITIAVVNLVPITLLLRYRSGFDVNVASDDAKAKIMGYVNGLKPQEPFIYNDAIEALRRVPGLIVTGHEIISPNGDVIPMALEVLRTDLSLITVGGQ